MTIACTRASAPSPARHSSGRARLFFEISRTSEPITPTLDRTAPSGGDDACQTIRAERRAGVSCRWRPGGTEAFESAVQPRSRYEPEETSNGPKLPLSAPGVATTWSHPLSAGIILGMVSHAVVRFSRGDQVVETPPRIAYFARLLQAGSGLVRPGLAGIVRGRP
jgi:hypothetical protein